MPSDPDSGDEPHEYASPACFMHEVDPGYFGLPSAPASLATEAIEGWRKTEREWLIARRLAVSAGDRATHASMIARRLDNLLQDLEGKIVSLYWPFRGEPDLRGWATAIDARGATLALPVVVKKHAPLIFRQWRPGDPLTRGVWNIPIPARTTEIVPDIVIAPVVGFDQRGYRLGYGGGFFDRTLAALGGRPQAIGVGYGQAAIATIYPLAHDIPMDSIVTEQALFNHRIR